MSRWHAYIAPGSGGFQLKDSSANGVYVNGQRVRGERWLSAGDTVRIGTAQFRFEPGAATADAGVMTLDTDQLTPVAAAPSRPRVETPLPNETVRRSRPGEAAMPEPPLLATLELVSDAGLKGKRFRITRPLVHVGRGRDSDVVIADKSVSSAHAKLQRRGNDWYVVDGESKNGTFVDGKRVSGERKMPVSCEIRFGIVKALFRALAAGEKRDRSAPGVVGIMDARVDKKPRKY